MLLAPCSFAYSPNWTNRGTLRWIVCRECPCCSIQARYFSMLPAIHDSRIRSRVFGFKKYSSNMAISFEDTFKRRCAAQLISRYRLRFKGEKLMIAGPFEDLRSRREHGSSPPSTTKFQNFFNRQEAKCRGIRSTAATRGHKKRGGDT